MNTKDKGDISEAEVTTALLRKGWSVSTPVGDNDRYDLIADTGQELVRVQVKTAHWENGKVVFNTSSVVSKSGGQTMQEYTSDEIDVFAAYSERTDEIYWVPVDECGSSTKSLRVEDAKKASPKINWAEDYLL